jgi:hypothetical protein
VVKFVKCFGEVEGDDFDAASACNVAVSSDMIVESNERMAGIAAWAKAILRGAKVLEKLRMRVLVELLIDKCRGE